MLRIKKSVWDSEKTDVTTLVLHAQWHDPKKARTAVHEILANYFGLARGGNVFWMNLSSVSRRGFLAITANPSELHDIRDAITAGSDYSADDRAVIALIDSCLYNDYYALCYAISKIKANAVWKCANFRTIFGTYPE